MNEICLSQGNKDCLRHLGFHIIGDSTNSTPRHVVQDHSCVTPDSWLPRTLEDATSALSAASNQTNIHDAILHVFVCLHLALSNGRHQSLAFDDGISEIEQIQRLDSLKHNSCRNGDNIESGKAREIVSDIVLATLKHRDTSDGDNPLIAEAGLASLALLLLQTEPSEWLDDPLLVYIATYTDSANSWTTPVSSDIARRILSSQLSTKAKNDLIIGPLLQYHVRPLLLAPQPRHRETDVKGGSSNAALFESDASSSDYARIATALKWAVTAAGDDLISENWHLFVPGLIKLLEDSQTIVRAIALETTSSFIAKCARRTLQEAGLSRLLEKTVFPTLLFLPTLTPAKESSVLLRLAYRVLIQLAELDCDFRSSRRRQLLDAILLEGILVGYEHSASHMDIVEVLMENTTKVISALGIFAIKHLETLLGIVESVLTNACICKHPNVVIVACDTMTAVIINCWPRVVDTSTAERIADMLAICWLVIDDEKPQNVDTASIQAFELAQEGLRQTTTGLQAMIRSIGKDSSHISQCAIVRDSRLVRLFGAQMTDSHRNDDAEV